MCKRQRSSKGSTVILTLPGNNKQQQQTLKKKKKKANEMNLSWPTTPDVVKKSDDKLDSSQRTWSTDSSAICENSSCDVGGRAPQPQKSCLKVRTQLDSLRILNEKQSSDEEQEQEQQQEEDAESTTGTITEMENKNKEKKVGFSTLEIRVYPVALGDNPCVSSGPPLTMGWKYDKGCGEIRLSVEEYEELHAPHRRSSDQLKIPADIRTEWLQQEGYARSTIARAQVTAMRCQRARLASATESNALLHLRHGRELVQRKLQRWILHAPSDKVLYHKWKAGQQQQHEQQTTIVISCSTA